MVNNQEIIGPSNKELAVEKKSISDTFIDRITGHRSSMNIVRLSPNEFRKTDVNYYNDLPNKVLGGFNTRINKDSETRGLGAYTEDNKVIISPEASVEDLDFSRPLSFDILPNSIARDSAHGVFFGILKVYRSGSEDQQEIELAVKPYYQDRPDRNYGRSLREFTNLHFARLRGIQTIRPFGVLLSQDRSYVLTYKEDITSTDNLPWSNIQELFERFDSSDLNQFLSHTYLNLTDLNFDGELDLNDVNPEANTLNLNLGSIRNMLLFLKSLGRFLAVMHKQGVIPQDSQLKNFTLNTEGEIWAIDWENVAVTFKKLGGEGTYEDYVAPDKAAYSISQLMLSLLKPEKNLKRGDDIHADEGISGTGAFKTVMQKIFEDLTSSKIPESEMIDQIYDKVWNVFDKLFFEHYCNTLSFYKIPDDILLVIKDKIQQRTKRLIPDIIASYKDKFAESHIKVPTDIETSGSTGRVEAA